ncbi:MAG: hypothetical protein ACI910_001192, partial [Oleispira sp.]
VRLSFIHCSLTSHNLLAVSGLFASLVLRTGLQ